MNIQPSCPACDNFHGQNDTYPDLSVHLRRETDVGKRMAKGDGTCGQDRCLGSHGDGRKRSRLEATLRVCAVTILVSDMAKYYFEAQPAFRASSSSGFTSRTAHILARSSQTSGSVSMSLRTWGPDIFSLPESPLSLVSWLLKCLTTLQRSPP